MRIWLTRKRIVWLSITAIVAFLLVDGFVAKPAHEVHTAGGRPLKATVLITDIRFFFRTVPASQSISELRCQLWAETRPNTPCPADVASTYLNLVGQAPNTLYVLWVGCVDWHGSGAIIKWQGYNLEYMPSERKLVIHCYVAEPWITHHPTLFGSAAIPAQTLLMVPTESMGRGTIQIIEDDRLEHLIGDQSTEFALGTVTIS